MLEKGVAKRWKIIKKMIQKRTRNHPLFEKYLEKGHPKIDAKKGGRKVNEGGVYTHPAPPPPLPRVSLPVVAFALDIPTSSRWGRAFRNMACTGDGKRICF